jgi:hypothetical protein
LIYSGFGSPLAELDKPGAAFTHRFHAMPLYFFSIRNGLYAGASDHGTELAAREAAWKESTSVCGDMAGCIARNLRENAEWQMELLGDSRTPIFQIRRVAETPDQNLGSVWP